MPNRPLPQFKPATCLACGGEWFSEASFYRFQREEFLSMWPGWPDLTGQATVVPMMVAVCLCGAALKPSIGGLRGGYTPNAELIRFLDSSEKARECQKAFHDGDA